MSMLRTFVAFKLSTHEREQVARVQRELAVRWRNSAGPLRPTRPEQLHLTVAFLGDTHADDVPKVTAALEEVARSHVNFRLSGAELLFLPKPRHAQVVALGFAEPSEHATALATHVVERLSALNFTFEQRRFLPHLTLFRAKRPLNSATLVTEPSPDESWGVVLELNQLAFYASYLEPSGARHELLSVTSLRGSLS
jgi:2'-5' RNA ligase